MPIPNVTDAAPSLVTEEQEKLWKLAASDADNLVNRASLLADSRYKSSFITSLELAMMWLRKAVATHSSPINPPTD